MARFARAPQDKVTWADVGAMASVRRKVQKMKLCSQQADKANLPQHHRSVRPLIEFTAKARRLSPM
jgi:hypothetical protein